MPYEDEYDEWATTSGLPIDGFRGVVTGLKFQLNHEIGPNVVVAHFTLTSADGQEVEQDFSVGSNHQPNRDGSELEGRAPFSDRSNFGMLIVSARELVPNIRDEIGNPRIAKNWLDTEWTFKTIVVESGRPGEKEKTKRNRPVFAAYHGRAGSQGTTTTTTTRKPATTATATPPVDADLWERLVEFARGSEDHGTFVGAALDWPEVDGDAKLQKLVASTGKGSVWAAR